MNKISECPICGKRVGRVFDWDETKDSTYYAVVCDMMKDGCGATGGHRKTPEEAIAAWNRRPEPRQLTLEELKQMNEQTVWMNSRKEWVLISYTHEDPFIHLWHLEKKGFEGNVLFHLEKFYDRPPGGEQIGI